MANNVKGFTKINVGYSYLVLIQEIQRLVIKWLKQIGTGRPTSSIYTMLWWMENANDSKMVKCFVCNYTFKYFAGNTLCNRYRSVILVVGPRSVTECASNDQRLGSLKDAILLQSSPEYEFDHRTTPWQVICFHELGYAWKQVVRERWVVIFNIVLFHCTYAKNIKLCKIRHIVLLLIKYWTFSHRSMVHFSMSSYTRVNKLLTWSGYSSPLWKWWLCMISVVMSATLQ